MTTGSGYKKAEEIFNKALYDYSTVEEWLTNIYYSDLVVTASFHGIIFAYVLRKNFIYMPLQGKYAKGMIESQSFWSLLVFQIESPVLGMM